VAGSFQGLPIPAGGHFLVSFVFAGLSAPAWLMALVSAGTGLLMISSIPFGNLKALRKGNLNKVRAAFLWGLAVTLIIALKELAPLAGIAIYIMSGPLGVDWGKWLSLKEEEKDSVGYHHNV
jgi:CDP-diacylglycerol--serine O-phosphatidyltransferase